MEIIHLSKKPPLGAELLKVAQKGATWGHLATSESTWFHVFWLNVAQSGSLLKKYLHKTNLFYNKTNIF